MNIPPSIEGGPVEAEIQGVLVKPFLTIPPSIEGGPVEASK